MDGPPGESRKKRRDSSVGAVNRSDDARRSGLVSHGGGPEDSAHFSAIRAGRFASLQEGDRMELEIVQGHEGRQAADATRAG